MSENLENTEEEIIRINLIRKVEARDAKASPGRTDAKVHIFLQTQTSCGMETGMVTPRALSLRNLVSGFKCGRVFPAGVGPGSPSRDAANWLPSRFSLSVETRR